MDREPAHRPVFLATEALYFPPVEAAREDGLLAVGGDLAPDRLRLAYAQGIFPWFEAGSPILWWSPDPRMVLFPEEIYVSKSMRKVLRDGRFRWSRNQCFDQVIQACAQVPREGQRGTWITPDMKQAYTRLHQEGTAVSYEVWEGDVLVGGLYGIDLGQVFCGESMFSRTHNASKFALIQMARELGDKGYRCIDCQVYTDHLARMGARLIPRREFIRLLGDGPIS